MFPPQIHRVFVNWVTEPGDIVYNPLSGRGTVPLEAVLSGRTGFDSDADSLAYSLAQSKVNIPSYPDAANRLSMLESSFDHERESITDAPEHIAVLYSATTLRQSVYLRNQLDHNTPADCFIIAMVLGMLHANHSRN